MKVSTAIRQHRNIATWIEDAKQSTIEKCIQILNTEFDQDYQWAIRVRGTRLQQLVSEVLTLELLHASDGQWVADDFAGKVHSTVVTSAIRSVLGVVQAHFRLLQIEHISV